MEHLWLIEIIMDPTRLITNIKNVKNEKRSF